MTSNDFMYGLHWLAVLAMLAVSWSRARSIIHPHFMLTRMLVVHVSDFLVRGYDDENITNIPVSNVYSYQLSILSIFVLTAFFALFIRTPRVEDAVASAWQGVVVTKNTLHIIAALAWLIVGAEFIKRLNSVGWSLSEVLSEMVFNARNDRVLD